MPTHFPHAVGEMGQKASDPGGWLLLQKRVLNPEDIRMLNVFSPRKAVTTREPRLRVSPRDSSRSEQRCWRDTRSPPRGCVSGAHPPVPPRQPGCCSDGNALPLGEREPALRAPSNAVFLTSYLSAALPRKATTSICPEGCRELRLPEKLQNQRREGRSLAGGGGGGMAFRERHAPGGRGAALSVQQAQNWASWWPPRAKPCHGQDDAHMSCQVHPCPAAADGCFTSPEGPPPRPQLSLSILARLGVPWEKLWRQQE